MYVSLIMYVCKYVCIYVKTYLESIISENLQILSHSVRQYLLPETPLMPVMYHICVPGLGIFFNIFVQQSLKNGLFQRWFLKYWKILPLENTYCFLYQKALKLQQELIK